MKECKFVLLHENTHTEPELTKFTQIFADKTHFATSAMSFRHLSRGGYILISFKSGEWKAFVFTVSRLHMFDEEQQVILHNPTNILVLIGYYSMNFLNKFPSYWIVSKLRLKLAPFYFHPS